MTIKFKIFRRVRFWSLNLTGFCAKEPTEKFRTANRPPEIGPTGFGVGLRTRNLRRRTTTMTMTPSAPATTASTPAKCRPWRRWANGTDWSSRELQRVNDANVDAVLWRFCDVFSAYACRCDVVVVVVVAVADAEYWIVRCAFLAVRWCLIRESLVLVEKSC